MAMAKEEKFKDDAAQELQLKLMVDKKKMRVVYAECGREMVDVLLSFLTTPVGALVSRTTKDSGLGSMDSLYKSVECIHPDHFKTPACRDLLLRPRSAFGFAYHHLKISINDAEKVRPYACSKKECIKYSLFPGVKCECGQYLTKPCRVGYPPPQSTVNVVFIREDLHSFIVTDDLFIAPTSDALKRNICSLAGVKQISIYPFDLEEQIVSIDTIKMVELMKVSLLSNTPLTDTFLSSDNVSKPINWPMEFLYQHLILPSNTKKENIYLHSLNKLVKVGKDFAGMISPIFGRKKMTLTLFHNHKRVLFAKAQKDFVDLLMSFLTFPFGSIVAAFGGHTSIGCLDNLHKIINKFYRAGYFQSTHISTNLLNPPIAQHHSCENHLLNIGKQPTPVYKLKCDSCEKAGDINFRCKSSQHSHFQWRPINPKYEGNAITERGGGYMRSPDNFVITSSLSVKPLHRCDENHFASNFYTGLTEKNVFVGPHEILNLLLASLTSLDPLTEVFFESIN